MNHSTTRWATLRNVVIRLIEQHKNLKDYFQFFFPKTTGFRDVKEFPRYERIKKILSEEGTDRYLSFVVYFATDRQKQKAYLLHQIYLICAKKKRTVAYRHA